MKLSRAAVAVAASALLTLAACGSSDSLGSGSDDTSSAPSESSEPTDAPTEEPTEETGGELTEASFLSAVTAAQLEAQTAQMDMSIDVAGQSITMNGELRGAETLEDSAMQAEMKIPGVEQSGTFTMILVDGSVYMSLGEMTGDKFFELPLDDPSAQQFLGQLQGQMNPAETTKALEGAITGFEAAGADTVDGEETTKYVLEVDAEKALANQGGMTGLPPGVELPKTLTYTFWLDGDDLPLRITADMGSLGDLDMHFSEWGEPVDIQAPKPGQITKQNPFAPAA